MSEDREPGFATLAIHAGAQPDPTTGARAVPIYELQDGWSEDISGARTFADLPKTCQAYVRRLEELSGARIPGIGDGPGREQVVMLHGLL